MIYWSDNGWPSLKRQLNERRNIIKITIPGRKATKNEAEFSTYFGGDALNAYLKDRGDDGPIFRDQFGKPITKPVLSNYWMWKMKDLGIITRKNAGVQRYGRGLHNLRDTFRTRWVQSGAKPHIVEAMMGHLAKVDPLGYDQSYENEEYVKEQLETASPYLNILTRGEAFGQVDKDEVKRFKRELEELKAGKNSRMEALEGQVKELTAMLKTIYEKPELAEKLKESG
jgi:hypothetical protein